MKKIFAIFALCVAVFAVNAQKSTGPAPRQHQVKKTMVQEPMRSLQTEAIVALTGTNLNHFTLGDPANLTSYGVSTAEFTNSCEYYNLNYYFATSTSGQFGTINPATGVQTIIRTGNNSGAVAYNHANNTMYGLSLGSTSTLYTIDPATGEETQVVAITDDADYFMMAMTITNDGRFIVVNASRESIDELDPTTGTLTSLVPAGFNINYGQDIAVDRETNTVYWAAFNADASAAQLYAVDLAGATLNLIGTFENQVSCFCPLNYSDAELARPAAVSNLTATPDADHALSVELAWTNPTLSIGGDNLTSLTSVELYRDGVLVNSFANPTVGGNMTYTDNTMTADGAYNYVVYAVNDAGNGVEASVRALVGNLCEYSIEMVDDYGDGWNGAAIEVYAGTTLMETATLSSGTDGTVLVPLPLGECSFVWVSGSYDEECSFTIYDPFNVPIYVSSGEPVAGTILTHENTCAEQEPFVSFNGTVTDFAAVVGNESPAQTVSVNSYGLTANIDVVASEMYEVSLDGETFAATATITAGEAFAATDLYVRFVPTAAGVQAGTITCTSGELTDVLNVNGEGVVCDAITNFPYTCEFNRGSADVLCWEIVDANGDGSTFSVYDWDEDGNPGVAAYMYNSTNDADDWLISPQMTLPENAAAKFSYRVASSNYPEAFSVYVIPEGATYESATQVLSTIDASNTTWQEAGVDISSYAGQTVNIAIKAESFADMYWLAIDHFIVDQSADIEESEVAQVSIYPNPASTVLNVHAENYSNVQIINFLGQVVYSANVTENDFQINVSNLSNGVYFIRLNGETTTTQKFIKK